MKKLLSLLSISIIAAFCFAATYVFFIRAFISNDSYQFNTLQGAFLGAFFAFIFLRIADGLIKINNRKARARNALIKYQLLFNHYLSSLHDDVYLIDNLLQMIQKANTNDDVPLIWTSRFTDIIIDKDTIIDIDNISLINEIMSLNDDLRKINDSLETINRTYDAISSSLLERRINIVSYVNSIKRMENQCKQIRGFIEKTKEELIRLLAITGILAKNDTLLGNLINFLIIKKTYPNEVINNLDNEICKVKKDIQRNAAKSQSKIDESM